MGLLLALLTVGVVGYSRLAQLGLVDAFYMTVITLSTVGFSELGVFDERTRLFSSFLIIAALLWGAWALQAVLGVILSDRFRFAVDQYRDVRRARGMRDHCIICGFGRIGRAAAAEFERNGEPYVVVDHDLTVVEELRERGLNVVRGDTTEDEALLDAGIKRASRLIAALSSDNDNIVTVLSARQLNPALQIASRMVEPEAQRKLRLAGADRVFSPYDIGGRRIALEMLRPHVGDFLHAVVFDEGSGTEVDEIVVHHNSEMANKTLSEIRLRQRFGVNLLAVRHLESQEEPGRASFELNAGGDTVIHPNDVLIVAGEAEHLAALHKALGR
jgi:voltage-gated potassium channel